LCLRRFEALADFVGRVLTQGGESPLRRARALLHTWLGAYYAVLLESRGVEHIHVHHGYFASWIAMVAARLLGVGFSMTLHGSDLLLHRAYLDTKLKNCKFCVTVSEFNRRYILEHYPEVEPDKVVVQRMGVEPLSQARQFSLAEHSTECLIMLAVGRLHPVKDHAFLVQACRQMKDRGIRFLCLIAGEGTERSGLEKLIRDLELQGEVKLLGHIPRRQLDTYYAIADLVVLTSQSEGIPLVLMEAMAHGKTVLAPAITGIPELVIDGKTGFLYHAGSPEDFVTQVEVIRNSQSALRPLQRAARQHVLEHFNRERNLAAFGNLFLARITTGVENDSHANPVLQQI
jgi:colanic acid/amylovoran biosynthesis glycosyltransferase